MKSQLFSYDNVHLVPKHSYLKSRADADTSTNFLGYSFRLPVLPANMLDVIDRKIAKILSEQEYFYIYHRFDTEDTTHCFVGNANAEKWKLISISVGVNEDSFRYLTDMKSDSLRIDVATIDIAHADHENVKPMILFLRKNFQATKIIVGNVATAAGYKYLCALGVDAVKVGIGGGSICTTKYQTGFHLPTAYSVWECAQLGLDIPIIADGGAKHFGDVAKALTLGATMVMSGGWFASCIDSPAKIKNGKKIYRGSTSYEAKSDKKHIEGRTLELAEGTTYLERMDEIQQALRSSISYGGGKDLSAFNNVTWHVL